MSNLVIFGASGFIGKHVLSLAPAGTRAVTRDLSRVALVPFGARWLKGDLLDIASVRNILRAGDVVLNLSYAAYRTQDDNFKMAENLGRACIETKVSRLVHCSTAAIIGASPARHVDETTECKPVTEYERTKYRIEEHLLCCAGADFAVCALRPTAVVGNGGENLRKLLTELRAGNPLVNMLRAALHGSRHLNLVPVRDVARALLHLAILPDMHRGAYLCSADDDEDNCYDKVEQILRDALGICGNLDIPSLPPMVLETILRTLRQGSGRVASRSYSSAKLAATGFHRQESIRSVVAEFVAAQLGPPATASVGNT